MRIEDGNTKAKSLRESIKELEDAPVSDTAANDSVLAKLENWRKELTSTDNEVSLIKLRSLPASLVQLDRAYDAIDSQITRCKLKLDLTLQQREVCNQAAKLLNDKLSAHLAAEVGRGVEYFPLPTNVTDHDDKQAVRLEMCDILHEVSFFDICAIPFLRERIKYSELVKAAHAKRSQPDQVFLNKQCV